MFVRIEKMMRIAVEYLNFNVFIRWFYEFSLVLFISAIFNLRLNPTSDLHSTLQFLSYTLSVSLFAFTFVYMGFVCCYFRKT